MVAGAAWSAAGQLHAASAASGASHWVFLGSALALPVLVLVDSLTGPLAVSTAEAWWLLALPADRRRMLWPQLARRVLQRVVVGLVLAALAWQLVGLHPVLLLVCLVPEAALALSLVRQTVVAPTWLISCVVTTLVVVAWCGQVVAAVALLVVTAVVALVLAERRLGTLDRYVLSRSGQRSDALGAAALELDGGKAVDLVALRCAPTSNPSHRLSIRGHGARAVAVAEGERVWRRCRPQTVAVAATVLVCGALGPERWSVATSALLLWLPLAALLGSLRRWVRSPGLRRTLPADRAVPAAMIVPSVLVSGVTALCLAGAWMLVGHVPPVGCLADASAAVAAALVAALSLMTGEAPSYTSGLVMTDAGPIPLVGYLQSLRGLDVILSAAAMTAMGMSGPGMLVTAVLCGLVRIFRTLR